MVPAPAPTTPSSTGPPVAFLIAAKTSSGSNWAGANVAQPPIIRLPHQRIHRQHIFVSFEVERVGDDGIRHPGHRVSGSQQNRRLNFAHFVHLRRAGQFSIRIAQENRARSFSL